ncbi:MAG: S-formylglutathione hydrolase, partial [Robiginitomaculum sp.]|nr:S-formylglutathione hydrolase [Robiginitomaculum sp.]
MLKQITMENIEEISTQKCFEGVLGYYQHQASTTNCDMKFTVFMPEQSLEKPVPVLYWLSGLTCTEDNFTTKAGAYKLEAELGIAIVAPDTSPRGDDVPDEDTWYFGSGAGFYLDAIKEPWSKNYNMYSYIVDELPVLLSNNFAVDLT